MRSCRSALLRSTATNPCPIDRGARATARPPAASPSRARRGDVQLDSGWVHIRRTKRAARDRHILVRHPALASRLGSALKHAPGEDLLFPSRSNVRRDLLIACEQPGIEPCSPNDLRRTYARWMRLARVPAEIVTPTMGHRDRRVERVYGRLSPEEIGALLTARFAPDCITRASDSMDSAGNRGRNGRRREAKSMKTVPRGGIEPPTRGFSVPVVEWPSPRASSRKPYR